MFSQLPGLVWENLGPKLDSEDLAACQRTCADWQQDIELRQSHRFAYLRTAITSYLELPYEGKPPGKRRLCVLPNARLATLDVHQRVLRIWDAKTGDLESSESVADNAKGLQAGPDGRPVILDHSPEFKKTARWGDYEWRVSDNPYLELWHHTKNEQVATVKCTQHRACEIALIDQSLAIVDRIGRTVLLRLPEL